MSTKTVAKLLASDPKFAAQFILQPKQTLEDYGMDPDGFEVEDAKALESVVRLSQESLRSNISLIGVEMATAAWGIGASCCNSKSVALRDFGGRIRR